MKCRAVETLLIDRGTELFNRPRGPVQFTELPAANDLLNDLDHHPHAFVLACVMDRQVRAERAWQIPYVLSQKLGGFDFAMLKRLSLARIRAARS